MYASSRSIPQKQDGARMRSRGDADASAEAASREENVKVRRKTRANDERSGRERESRNIGCNHHKYMFR